VVDKKKKIVIVGSRRGENLRKADTKSRDNLDVTGQEEIKPTRYAKKTATLAQAEGEENSGQNERANGKMGREKGEEHEGSRKLEGGATYGRVGKDNWNLPGQERTN